MRRHIARDAAGVVVLHQILRQMGIHRELALGTNDLRGVLLSVGHHARAVVVRNLTAPKLNHANGIIKIVILLQRGLDGRDTVRRDALGHDVVAKEPQGQVDIVDSHVDKDAARPRGVGDVETGRVVLVACLAAQDRGPADAALGGLGVGVAVRRVEASREAAHDLEVRLGLGGVDHVSALGREC